MSTFTHSPIHPYATLTKDQQARADEIWHDGLPPTDFLYELQGGQVIGRVKALQFFSGKATETDYGLPPALPQPVSSSRRKAQPLTLKQIERELEFPYPGAHRRKRRGGLGALLIKVIAGALYQIQPRTT